MDLRPIGPRIKAAREKKKLTQEELAELVDLSPMHLSVLERGLKPPRLANLIKIANVLGVSADELLQDVVTASSGAHESVIASRLEVLPEEDRKVILRLIDIYLDEHNTKSV